MTGFLKENFITEYMAALIETSGEDSRYVPEARRKGIQVLAPDVNESKANFTLVSDELIRYGLSSINGVGWKGACTIADAQPWKDKEEWDKWYNEGLNGDKRPDHRSLNSRAIKSLQRVGAMECLGDYFKGDKSKAEKELIGTYVSHNPLDPFREIIDGYVLDPENVENLNGGVDCGKVYVGGMVDRVHEHKQKNGKMMAFITVKLDPDFEWDLVVFANIWAKIMGDVSYDKVIIAKGEWQAERESVRVFDIKTQSELEGIVNENSELRVSASGAEPVTA